VKPAQTKVPVEFLTMHVRKASYDDHT
jgi:hypothetical protein